MSEPPFGVLPAGQPLLTVPTQAPSETSFLYTLPTAKPFSHIVVFLLPGVTLPPNTAAAIYLSTISDVTSAAQNGAAPNFRFLGGIGPGKESAIFKVSGSQGQAQEGLMIGVEVESEEAVGQRLQELALSKSGGDIQQTTSQPSTVVLAQRIIQNAFNFLASFSGQTGPGGVEVVPLKAFENWWKKFESRVRADPSFLEKQQD